MTRSIRQRLFKGGIAAGISSLLMVAFVGLAFAAPGSGGTRPGWGCGDTNHVHTGPPGLGVGAVSPCGSGVGQGHGPGSTAAVHFALSTPSTVAAGSAFNFTVTAEDRDNNVLTSFGDSLQFSSSDTSASLPAPSTLSGGTGTFTATLNTAGNQTITATDTSNGDFAGTSNAIAVTVFGATHFSVAVPTTATHGTAFTVTVAALDQNNNTVSSYGGTIHFSSSDRSASLPADSTLTNGSGSFSVTLNATGNQAVTVSDTSNGTLTGTSAFVMVS